MPNAKDYNDLFARLAALRATLINQNADDLVERPSRAEALTRAIDDILDQITAQEANEPQPPDGGLSELIGIGPDAADDLDDVHLPHVVKVYDERVSSERVLAVADLYYIYQHEKMGVFRTILKLQELFKAGTVRLSSGDGAYQLYQYDRRQSLRYMERDRMQTYRRVFGYTRITPPEGATPNADFHRYMMRFTGDVAEYFRDRLVTEVIKRHDNSPAFSSVARVRRGGLDLRNNVKSMSYGNVNVLRIEVMQLLREAFDILGTPDIRKLFGADDAWEVIEEVQRRYMKRAHPNLSQRSRMAIAGRNILRWLASGHIQQAQRSEFEGLLYEIADDCEEWLTSAQFVRNQDSRRVSKPQPQRSEELEAEVMPYYHLN